jgi:hypothetical protein
VIYSNATDLTMKRRIPGPGMDPRPLWLCGHRHRHGKKKKVMGLQPLLWRCLDCANGGKA